MKTAELGIEMNLLLPETLTELGANENYESSDTTVEKGHEKDVVVVHDYLVSCNGYAKTLSNNSREIERRYRCQILINQLCTQESRFTGLKVLLMQL